MGLMEILTALNNLFYSHLSFYVKLTTSVNVTRYISAGSLEYKQRDAPDSG